ncbi:MAG: hypothetical protein F4114_08225 [Rhodospirillaceae bacterium]|nr:hypothetical protein [Rhodospirillaceae bacterium]MYB14337.1 hypothetical protein [Rhodospirillaceae bacterium]MYI49057.1 hypothetical protein [Rhodospirillaceae bacterium]
MRLDKSCEPLRRTALPIPDIAAATGSSGAAFFAAAFRKRFGLAPSLCRVEPRQSTPSPTVPANQFRPINCTCI